jgi:hypothetical protein
MASRINKLGVASLTAIVAIVAFIAFSPKNDSSGHNVSTPPERPETTKPTEVDVPVNFKLPLYTKSAALVCPLAVAFDRREGHGLKEAVDAHLSIFGHEDAIEKSGCQEWREGLSISLSDEGQKQADEWGAEKSCGMVSFSDGYIFSCDLRNSPGANGNKEIVEHAKQEISAAMQDPSKVRLMECVGVNTWEVKPAGWVPPTKEECALLQQKLGAAADARKATAAPENPSQELALLIAEEEKLNDKCRGGSGDDKATLEACDERDALYKKIEANNWCWGHDGQIGADRTWEPCHRGNSGQQSDEGTQATQ